MAEYKDTSSANIGAAMNLLVGMQGLKQQTNLNKENREFASKESALQYQRSLNLMNLENEYGSPASQVERLKEANLSPSLMYGSSGAGGQSASAASPQMASYEGKMSEGSLNLMANAMAQMATIRNIEADTDLKRSQAGETDSRSRLNEVNKIGQEIDNIIQNATTQDQIKLAHAEVSKAIEEIKNLKADELLKNQDLFYKTLERTWGLQLMELDAAIKEAEIDLKKATTDKEKQEIQESIQRISKMKVEMHRLNMQTAVDIKNAKTNEEGMLNQSFVANIMAKDANTREQILNFEKEKWQWQKWMQVWHNINGSIDAAANAAKPGIKIKAGSGKKMPMPDYNSNITYF